MTGTRAIIAAIGLFALLAGMYMLINHTRQTCDEGECPSGLTSKYVYYTGCLCVVVPRGIK